jgi:1,2-diacylglycerol 3-beta-glucosyltransferase
MFATSLLILAVLYACQFLVFGLAALAARYRHKSDVYPTVDIIIAARNEEARIGNCLGSLLRLTYPSNLLKIVIVDDGSHDRTAEIIQQYADQSPCVRLMKSTPSRDHLKGKANAITQAIEATSGEIILMTDADCEVPPQWIENTVRYYDDDSIGIVAGFTSLKGTSLFERMQALDWLVLFSVASGVNRLGFPVTAVGTNLSVRRRAYEAVGGYRKIPFSVTEDYALFHAVTHGGEFKARFPRDPGTLVESYPCPTIPDLYRQKKRWFTGGKGMDVASMSIFALTYVFTLALIVGACIEPSSLLFPLLIKLASDMFLSLVAASGFGRIDTLFAFPFYVLYYSFYVVVYPPLVLFTSGIVWKGREFSERKGGEKGGLGD